MEVMTYGPFIVGRDLELVQAFYYAQRLWDCFPDNDFIDLKDNTGYYSRILKNSKYPCICFEFDPYDGHLYKIGMYSNYRGAIRAFSRRASALRDCHYRTDLQLKYSDVRFVIWDAENGTLLQYRHYYGHNTRIQVDCIREV